MEVYISIIILLLVALTSLIAWKTFILYSQTKRKTKNIELSDRKYYELKYQMQYITTIFPVILVMLGIFGYNQIDSLNKKIEADVLSKLNPKIDSLTTIMESLQAKQYVIDSGYRKLDIVYDTLFSKQILVNSQVDKTKINAQSLLLTINKLTAETQNIQSKDIIQQDIYIVGNMRYNQYKDQGKVYRYSDLTTITGKKLPTFNKTPIVLGVSTSGEQVILCNVNNKDFTVYSSGGIDDSKGCLIKDEYVYSLIIIKQ